MCCKDDSLEKFGSRNVFGNSCVVSGVELVLYDISSHCSNCVFLCCTVAAAATSAATTVITRF